VDPIGTVTETIDAVQLARAMVIYYQAIAAALKTLLFPIWQ
jgi:hypothetical protein